MSSLRQSLFIKQSATPSDYVWTYLLPQLHQASHQAKGQSILHTLSIGSPHYQHGHQLSFTFPQKYCPA